jgi:uncharacterized protein YjbJ (UPF0337 family)
MVSQQVLSGHWHEVAGKLREKWEQLSADDVHAFDGNIDKLISRIQHVTGESREQIQQFLDQLGENGYSVFADLRSKMADMTDQATDTAREGIESVRQGYAAAERAVQERPGQIIAMAFGLGVVAGLGAVLLLREKRQDTRVSQARTAAEQFGKQLLDAWAELKPDAIARHFKG